MFHRLRVASGLIYIVVVLIQASCVEHVVQPTATESVLLRAPLDRRSLSSEELTALGFPDRSVAVHLSAGAAVENAPNGPMLSSQSTCGLGAVACGGTEATRQYYNFLAWASTWRQNPAVSSLSVHAFGSFRQGWGFPIQFFLGDDCAGVASCSDSESFSHTCSSERNAMSVASIHAATMGSALYTAQTQASEECDDAGDGGGGWGSGGLECSYEAVIVEIYNEETGFWDYFDTIWVEVCV